MSKLNLPVLYRHILRAAQKFPSIKRDTIVQEIKAEFAANKVTKVVVHDAVTILCPPTRAPGHNMACVMFCCFPLQFSPHEILFSRSRHSAKSSQAHLSFLPQDFSACEICK